MTLTKFARHNELKPKIQPKASSGHLIYVDVIRAWAIYAVIVLHVSSPLVGNIGGVEPNIWWWANFYDSLVRSSVPLFVMISGLLLLNPRKDESPSLFFRKRTMKVIIPFLFWGIVYLFFKSIVLESSFGFSNLTELIVGPIYTHFWFIYMLVGLYLATPILRLYTREANSSHYFYFGTLWFICAGVLPFFEHFSGITIAFKFVVAISFTGYFILGIGLRDIKPTVIQRWIVFIAFLIAWVTTMVGSALISVEGFDGTFYEYLSPNVMVLTLSSFILFKSILWDHWIDRIPGMNRMLSLVSSTSLGVYFIHYMLLEIFRYGNLGFVLDGTTFHPSIAIPIVGLVVHATSCGLIWILSKIPFGKYVVP